VDEQRLGQAARGAAEVTATRLNFPLSHE
jgi:hypothetical protein